MHLIVLLATLTGTVSDARSHWTADGSRIVTDATVSTPAGDVVVRQLGGTVDGVTMRTIPGPPVLQPGMVVDVLAHPDVDLSLHQHVVVDDVKIIEDVPGFVRTGPTKAGHYLYWESGCIFVTADSEGTAEIAGDGEFAIIDASIATWNDDTHVSTCSYMQVVQDQAAAVEVGRDNKNVIKFRDTQWCRPAIQDDPMRCYAPSAAGITTVAYIDDGTSSRDGALLDADIEINGVNFAISVNGQSLGTAPCAAELQNTLTHELGHLHGLEHTCLAPGDPMRIDNNGNAVPLCSQTTDPAILDATMYNYQDCGETKKETLSPDDMNAICTIYPESKDPHTCSPVGDTGGCCGTSRDARGALGLAALVGLALSRRRRNGR
jgi:MYXO-CTERM domain-containing protein